VCKGAASTTWQLVEAPAGHADGLAGGQQHLCLVAVEGDQAYLFWFGGEVCEVHTHGRIRQGSTLGLRIWSFAMTAIWVHALQCSSSHLKPQNLGNAAANDTHLVADCA
jgi:hypothetical protein